MFPDLNNIFGPLKRYRYAVATGLFLMFFVSMLFPVGWSGVAAYWRYVMASLFFISVGMIITYDLIPFFRKEEEQNSPVA